VPGLFVLALYERDFAAADRALALLTDRVFGEIKLSIYFNRAIAQGVIAHAKGCSRSARAFTATRAEVEQAGEEDPDHGGTRAVLGFVYAGCGLKRRRCAREGTHSSLRQ
jgi:hypothetical protein